MSTPPHPPTVDTATVDTATGATLEDPLAPYRAATRPPRDDRPWVLANMVAGVDGSTAIDGRVGALSGPVDRRLFVDLRSVADVVLVGAETARRERYGPIGLGEERVAHRVDQGRSPLPRLAVVSRSLVLDDLRIWDRTGGPEPMVITCEDSPTDARSAIDGRAEIIIAGTSRVDPATMLRSLRQRGADVVLCEGGPSLLGDLLAADVVDELCLTLTSVVGGDPLPVAVLPLTATARRASLAHVLRSGDDLFLRYLLR